MNTHNSSDDLRIRMEKMGAREFEVVALSMDEVRGHAALDYAEKKGAQNPIAYAIKMFDNEDWQPSGETRRVATNLSVTRQCEHCGNDGWVVVTHDPSALYGETYAPCEKCNSKTNTERWVLNQRVSTAPR